MRTVLVCVRTPLAAQNIVAAAARLGLAGVVRAAVSDPEVMLRLTESPADIVLVDTALTRPDSIGFIRRVLARAPRAAVLLFGTEERGVGSAAVAAGARGLIHGGDHDLVSVVAKAMLLLAVPGRAGRNGPASGAVDGRSGERRGRPDGGVRQPPTAGTPPLPANIGPNGTTGVRPATVAAGPNGGPEVPAAGGTRPALGQSGAGHPSMVPVQRGEDAEDDEAAAGAPDPQPNEAPEARFTGARADVAAPDGPARPGPGGPSPSRATLTERELQVLLGMADGKSNAEIGRELFVSEDTVKTHARRLFRKLGARDRAHAVAAGFRAGLVG